MTDVNSYPANMENMVSS